MKRRPALSVLGMLAVIVLCAMFATAAFMGLRTAFDHLRPLFEQPAPPMSRGELVVILVVLVALLRFK